MIMRARIASCLCLIIVVAASASAWGEAVTLPELEGHVINATIVRQQVIRRDGRQLEVRANQKWDIALGPDLSITTTVADTAQTPRGERKARLGPRTQRLGQPRTIASRGGGEAVWQFEDGALTFVRTWKQGAYRASFTLSRSAEGLTCTVSESYGREGGRGAVVLESVFDGAEITLISSKQMSATCTIAKAVPPEPPAAASGGRGPEYELAYWESIKTSRNVAAFESYLKAYPTGAFVELAKLRIEELQRTDVEPQPTAAPARRKDRSISRGVRPEPAARARRSGRGESALGPPGPLRGTGIGQRCRSGDNAACRTIQARCNAGFRRACTFLGGG